MGNVLATRQKKWVLLVLGSLWFSQIAYTKERVLQPDVVQYPLGLELEILEDKEKQWSITEVSSPEFEGPFLPSSKLTPQKTDCGMTQEGYPEKTLAM